jgi:hypothetical protein
MLNSMVSKLFLFRNVEMPPSKQDHLWQMDTTRPDFVVGLAANAYGPQLYGLQNFKNHTVGQVIVPFLIGIHPFPQFSVECTKQHFFIRFISLLLFIQNFLSFESTLCFVEFDIEFVAYILTLLYLPR